MLTCVDWITLYTKIYIIKGGVKHMKRLLAIALVLTMLLVFGLAGCTPDTETPTDEDAMATEEPVVEDDKEEEATAEPVVEDTPEPTAVPTTRTGGWLDSITIQIVDSASSIIQVTSGEIDIYADTIADKASKVALSETNLEASTSFGINYEITFNPGGTPTFDGTGKLNPFSSAKVREAMNLVLDRDYINQEVYGGTCVPRYTILPSIVSDYARYIETIRAYEAKYAYDFDAGVAVIDAEMEAMGATKEDGKYMFEGEQVNLIFLIRNDSDGTRIPIGDYVSDQLEIMGFMVDRQYKTSPEASAIWVGGNVNDGEWNLYTGAWGLSGMSRDEGSNFQFYASPTSPYGSTSLWQSYGDQVTDEQIATMDALANNDFSTMEERDELFKAAFEIYHATSFRIWLIDGVSQSFWDPSVTTSFDLAAGVDTSPMTAHTLRFKDQEGGDLTWGTSGLFIDPYNGIGGSNWTFDAQVENLIEDAGVLTNPYTGLQMPQRIQKAEVVVETGLPVAMSKVSEGWLTLSTSDAIEVPADAWIDYDVETDTFITTGDMYPDGVTVKRKSTVYYPSELYDITWHDGTPISIADFVMAIIMSYAPADPASEIYDEALANALDASNAPVKGIKIISEDPLTIEVYSDVYYLDAEACVSTMWFEYGYGNNSWYQLAAGNAGQANLELAYTSDLADANEVEWTSFLGGPSLDILAGYLTTFAAEGFIPFEATLSQYITADEATTAYNNLLAFNEEHGHMRIGTGAYILDQAFLTEKIASLVNNTDYPDLANKWSSLSAPKIADVEIDAPASLAIGSDSVVTVYVDYDGAAYPSDEINSVKWLLYDSDGTVSSSGEAMMVAEGEYEVSLSAEATGELTAGSCGLEIAVVSGVVALPSFAKAEFPAE